MLLRGTDAAGEGPHDDGDGDGSEEEEEAHHTYLTGTEVAASVVC